jgi:hypothetical protein
VIIVNHDILYLNAAKITDFKCTYTHRISVWGNGHVNWLS